MVKDSMRASFILGQWRAYHIPLVNLLAVLVFQPRVLADGGRIDPDPVFHFFAPNEGCLVARIELQGTEYPFPFCDTYTSVPNLSHNLVYLIRITVIRSAATSTLNPRPVSAFTDTAVFRMVDGL